MIRLTDRLPESDRISAEWVKIRCLFECYPDTGLFWVQDGGNAVIGMIDGNMSIDARNPDMEELREFVSVIAPCCVFSDLATLKAIGREPAEEISVMARKADLPGTTPSDEVSSREIYDLLYVPGLSLPEYPYFAVDYCRRINHGMARRFAKKGVCAAITLNMENFAIMNGIASHQKGGGTLALTAILQENYGNTVLACCRQTVRGFYEKNGFKEYYKAGYWVK